ncbi:MAG: transposase [Fibrobacter sp.]|nr:transposase [Fibrobacter sp.]
MTELARKKRAKKIFGFRGYVYAFDSTTIDLCLEFFEWAKFRSTKGGVTVHTLLDVETQVPSFLLITEAKVNDVKAMDSIPYETRSYYVFDRDYNGFERHALIDSLGCFFIIRARRNSMTSRVAELYKNRWLVELFFK